MSYTSLLTILLVVLRTAHCPITTINIHMITVPIIQITCALRIHNFSSVTTHSFYYYNFPWWAKVIALLECFVTSDLLCLLRIPPVVVSLLYKLLPSVYILSVIRYPHSLSSCLRGCSIVVAMAPRVQIITHSDTSFLQDELCCL